MTDRTDIPAGEWTVDDAIVRAWEFGMFAALAINFGVRHAAEWYRDCGADLNTALAALRCIPKTWMDK